MADVANKTPSTTGSEGGKDATPGAEEGKKEQAASNTPSSNQSETVRENMISTAVKFLQNPKVRQSPFPQRKAFLLKKGLTAKELQVAIDRSGTASDEHRPIQNLTNNQATISPTQPASVVAVPNTQEVVPTTAAIASRHYRWRDIAVIAALVAGAFYGIKVLITRFIMPWFKQQKDNKEHLRRIETSVGELRADVAITVGGLQSTLESVKDSVSDLQTKVDMITRGPLNQGGNVESHVVGELKKDLATIKGLMLSRQQFPSAPKLPQRNSSIPSWQKSSTEVGKLTNGSIENGIDKKIDNKFTAVNNEVNDDESTNHREDAASELHEVQSNDVEINGIASEADERYG
ncbi:uncharacterized protein TRIADDRAFT_57725 [Trichoplax adhaerens]|uniref:Peroxisomal membrane protein PEX14 n=1 Tax=Trichoplax adhaerens TaxID=10228 RepID=B3S087_TRIAD|nr:hypothetical protein TRIADDRAFT_57725 [Trichoplax adhaerens]EDV24344.1 hypothetical protein TRIADDRAFT_57725 [Trichoplax adhaerens]|eukprot:XP_002113870.1 hypothetical protein TRIADDRAFT_57725 [Trichoplax adhaerens]